MDDEQMIPPPLRDSVPAKVPRRPQEPPSEQDLAAARAYCGLLRTLRDVGGLEVTVVQLFKKCLMPPVI
ncbi:hypothetical protein V1527DRAFT_475932 [Lipomyces starkeyi]